MLLFMLMLLQTDGPPPPVAPSSPEVFADVVAYQGLSQEVWAEGHVELRVVNGRLTAQRLSASQKTGWFSAEGHVVVRWADATSHWAVLADVVHIRLKPSRKSPATDTLGSVVSEFYEVEEIFLENGLWVQKHDVKANVLLESHANQVLQLGKNGLSMRLEHMRQKDGRWEFKKVGFVPCDCETTEPSWHLESYKGTLDIEGQRTNLLSTLAYVGEVPIFWVPWISLPNSSRQTGLLFPLFSVNVNSGFMPRLPVFITLGRSADFTLTPGWAMGTQNVLGVRGPSLGTEFRYTPSENIQGSIAVDGLWDLREQRSPVDAGHTASNKQRGLRYGTRLDHRQSIGEHGRLLANVNVASDGYLHRDFETDLILKSLEYTRSQVGLSYEGPHVDLLLDLGYLQDLRWGYPLLGNAPLLAPGDPPQGPNTLQRFPALSMTLREQPLGNGFSFVMHSSFVRLAPWRGLTGDEGPDAREGDDRIWINGRWETLSIQCMRERLYQPRWRTDVCPQDMPALLDERKALQGDGRYQPGEREARDRLGVLPVLKYQKRFWGGGAGVAASLGMRQDLWLGEVSGRWFSRGYPLLKLQAEGTLAKEMREGLWHTLTPLAELRWVAAQWGKAPVGYDATDLAIPRGYRGLEFAAGLRQSLWRHSANAMEEFLSLELSQAAGVGVEAEKTGARVGDTFLKFSSRWRFLEPALYTYVDLQHGQFSRFGTSLRAQWPNTLGGHIQYDIFQTEGGEWSRRGMDMLIGFKPSPLKATHSLGLGLWGKLQSFHFRYGMSFFELGEKFRFAQHSMGAGWTPACNCFGFELHASQTMLLNSRGEYALGMPNFGFSFQLQGLGGWGVQQ